MSGSRAVVFFFAFVLTEIKISYSKNYVKTSTNTRRLCVEAHDRNKKNVRAEPSKTEQFNSNLKCNFKTLFSEFYWQLWGFSSSLWIFYCSFFFFFFCPFCILLFWNEKLDFLFTSCLVCVWFTNRNWKSNAKNRWQKTIGKRTSSFSLYANTMYQLYFGNSTLF